MRWSEYKKWLDKVFRIAIALKVFLGFSEILTGLLFAVSGQKIVNNIILYFAQQEITEDPHDLLASFLLKISDFIVNEQLFAIIYLIFHGILNIMLSVALAKQKLEFYPASISLFILFLIYQVYKYVHSYSIILLLLIIFDVAFVAVITLEYRRLLKPKLA